jgi:hypothetical protein
MNIKDLEDFEIEDAPTESKPLNLADLGQDFEELDESEDTIVTPEMEDVPAPKAAAAAGALAGASTDKTARALGDTLYKRIGVLSPEQLATIEANPNAYKKMTAESWMDNVNALTKDADAALQNSFDFRNKGVESLNIAPIKSEQILQSVADINSPAKKNLPPSMLPKPQANQKDISQLENLLKQKKELEAGLASRIDSGIESNAISSEIKGLQDNLNAIDSDISKVQGKISTDMTKPPGLSEYSKVTGVPEEVLELRPDLMTKNVDPMYTSAYKDLISSLPPGVEVDKDNIAKLIREVQDKANYGNNLSVAPLEKFYREAASNISQQVKDLPGAEGYKKGQELSSKAIRTTERLGDFGIQIKPDITGKKSEAVLSSDSQLKSLFTKGNEKKLERFNKAADELERLKKLAVDMNLSEEELLKIASPLKKDLPLSYIKNVVETAKDSTTGRIIKGGIGAGVGTMVAGPGGGVLGAGLANAVAPTGTKLQEYMALMKSSQAAKNLSKGVKVGLPLAGGLLAGGLAATDDRIDEFSPWEKAGAIGGEVLNPIPFTDVIGGMQEAKKVEGVIPSTQAFLKGYAAPLATSETIQENKRIREMETGRSLSPSKKPEEVLQSGKLETTDGPELTAISRQLEAMTDNKAAQEYARVLNSIISSPSKNKEAQISVLNQQPAFRELMRKTKGEQK